MAGKFELYKSKNGEFRFRLKASNGQVIAVGEGYKSKKSCLNGIESIRNCLAPLSDAPPICYGVDLAKSVDYTVVVGLDDEGRVATCERWHGVDWKTTVQRIEELVGDAFALVDSTGLGDPVVEQLQSKCLQIEGFKFSSNSKQQLAAASGKQQQQAATSSSQQQQATTCSNNQQQAAANRNKQ